LYLALIFGLPLLLQSLLRSGRSIQIPLWEITDMILGIILAGHFARPR
jgi:hypothetical protein